MKYIITLLLVFLLSADDGSDKKNEKVSYKKTLKISTDARLSISIPHGTELNITTSDDGKIHAELIIEYKQPENDKEI